MEGALPDAADGGRGDAVRAIVLVLRYSTKPVVVYVRIESYSQKDYPNQ